MSLGINRSTKEQIHLRKCMEALFGIHNYVISKTKSSDLNPFFLHQEIKSLLNFIFQKEFIYDEKDNPELFTAGFRKINIAREDYLKGHVDRGIECIDFGTGVHVSKEELIKIPELINLLKMEIQNGKSHHFVLGNESKTIENTIALSTIQRDQRKKEYIGSVKNIDGLQGKSFSPGINWNEVNKRKKSLEKSLKHLNDRCSYTGDQFVIISTHVRYFSVDPITEFAQEIMQMEPGYRQINDGFPIPENFIPSIDTLGQYTEICLMDVIKSLFVHFHVEHVNFKGIKLCEYHQCRNMMVEIQKGKKRFCSPRCKTKYNNSNDDPEKHRCRSRQNKYLERYKNRQSLSENPISFLSIFKVDCEQCDYFSGMKGGACPKLKEKNPAL